MLVVGSTFTDVLWWLFAAFLLAAYFYILIVVFADLFTNEWNGWITAIWTFFIFFFPLIGILAYLIFRPHPTPEQQEAMFRQQHGISTAEELSMLSDLHDKGALSDEEFAKQKAKLLG
jgi:Short C-terminal domain/Phospholipase_D-nuclease N-terminal